MHKQILTLILTILFCLNISAEKKSVQIKPDPRKETTSGPLRQPSNIMIEAVYDDEAMTLEIFCVNDVEAEVYVYNASDEVEGYSPCLNTIIPLSPSPYHTIVIEGSDWTATGSIE